jgi:hypothetical protein
MNDWFGQCTGAFMGPRIKYMEFTFVIYLLYEMPSGVWRNGIGFRGWPIACTAIWNQIAQAFFQWGWINWIQDPVPKSLHTNIVHDFCFWKLKYVEMDKNFSIQWKLALSLDQVRASPVMLRMWLQKHFSHPSLGIYFFPTLPTKPKLRLQTGIGR